MPPRFDPQALRLELSVADLLDTQLLRSLGFAHRGGYERLWLGQAIHSRYQEEALERDATYRREVTIRHELDHRGWRVGIQGRADGLRRDADGRRVVEEIKSIRRGQTLSPTVREVYARQAALYAWMLARHDLAAASDPEQVPETVAELVLIEIGGEDVERQPVEVHLDALDALVLRRLNGLLRGFRARQEQIAARRDAAEVLAFPYPERRTGQEAIIDGVGQALEERAHLLVEAPTGLGKTVAALYPALRAALRDDLKVFVLTAKTLQQDMAMAVASLLNRDGAFRSLRLRAKHKMCANDQVLCHEEYCPFAREYYAKLQRSAVVPRLLDTHETLLPEFVFDAAVEAEVCPFEVSLELGGHVQLAVCDYNYAFEPYVSLTEFADDADLSHTVLVIDEIHNLVDRGRRYYSPTLSSEAARRAAEDVALGGAPIHRQLAALCGQLEQLIYETVADLQPGRERSWAIEQRLPEEELWRLRAQLDRAFVDYLEYRRETKTLTADDRFVDLYFVVLKFLNAIVLSDAAFSHFVEREGDDYRFRILCKDPSRFLGKVLDRCHSAIGLSATLSPFEFYRDLLGFDPDRTTHLRVPNPFPAEHRRVVVDTEVATTYRERPAFAPVIAERLGAFADAVPGNCLALFPSYAFLADIASLLQTRDKRVLVQRAGDGDRQREDMLDTLRGAILGDVLLLAVAGGVFAEGVDYPGDVLKAVAVVGPCLPALTLEQQLLQSYYDERFERGFEYAFIVPGMTRVVQAAGRLIRSPDDRGVIALFDKRFLYRAYRDHLPTEWLPPSGKARQLAGDPEDVARTFFEQQKTLAWDEG